MISDQSSDTDHWPNAGSMLYQRLRHSIDPALGKLFDAMTQQTRYIDPMLGECWSAVSDVGPTFTQHWVNVSCLLGGAFTKWEELISSPRR